LMQRGSVWQSESKQSTLLSRSSSMPLLHSSKTFSQMGSEKHCGSRQSIFWSSLSSVPLPQISLRGIGFVGALHAASAKASINSQVSNGRVRGTTKRRLLWLWGRCQITVSVCALMTFSVLVAAVMLSAAPAKKKGEPKEEPKETPPVAAAKLDGKPGFEFLKKLEGTWKSDGSAFLTVRAAADGGVVLLTVTGADHTKLIGVSAFHLEGGELVVTQYLASGPKKMLAKKAEGDQVRFSEGDVSFTLTSKGGQTPTLQWDAVRGTVVESRTWQREYVDTLK
jgi:hypothetical protein